MKIKKQYNDTGIYGIFNNKKPTEKSNLGMCYIGQSIEIDRRTSFILENSKKAFIIIAIYKMLGINMGLKLLLVSF